MRQPELTIGETFHFLTIEKNLGIINRCTNYLCRCVCGNTRVVNQAILKRGGTKSCGCKNFTEPHANRKYSAQEASYRGKACSYKANAKKRRIEFLLTIEETCDFLKDNCFYCGIEPYTKYNVRKNSTQYKTNQAGPPQEDFDIFYNGIDRIDNNKGYIKKNCVSCCTQCNTAKLTFSTGEFREWIKRVYNNLIKKG